MFSDALRCTLMIEASCVSYLGFCLSAGSFRRRLPVVPNSVPSLLPLLFPSSTRLSFSCWAPHLQPLGITFGREESCFWPLIAFSLATSCFPWPSSSRGPVSVYQSAFSFSQAPSRRSPSRRSPFGMYLHIKKEPAKPTLKTSLR